MKTYTTPWSRILHIASWLATIVVLASLTAGVIFLRRHGHPGTFPIAAAAPALIVGLALFAMSAHRIAPDTFFVRRLNRWIVPSGEGSSIANADPGASPSWKTIRL